MCRRPLTGSGVPGGRRPWGAFLYVFFVSTISGSEGTICAAYVFPRTTRRLYMMFACPFPGTSSRYCRCARGGAAAARQDGGLLLPVLARARKG